MRSSLLVKLTAFLIPLSIALTWAAPVSLADFQSAAQVLCEGSSDPDCVANQVATMEANAAASNAETQAENENFICDAAGILQLADVSAEMGARNDSFIATEIYEPIGGFEQKIKAGDLTVSQVFWKFNCITKKTHFWDGGSILDQESVNYVTISGYVPYENGCPTSYDQCSIVQIIIGQSGTAILKTYVALFYRWAAGVVGIVAVLVIVISGIQISMDQGSGENLSAAKTRIFQAISGLVILFLASLILYTINPTFFK